MEHTVKWIRAGKNLRSEARSTGKYVKVQCIQIKCRNKSPNSRRMKSG